MENYLPEQTDSQNDKFTNSDSQSPEVTAKEAGRLGGLATISRYGRNHFQTAGKLGQVRLAELYTKDDRRRWGKLGGRPKKRHLSNMERKGE